MHTFSIGIRDVGFGKFIELSKCLQHISPAFPVWLLSEATEKLIFKNSFQRSCAAFRLTAVFQITLRKEPTPGAIE